MRLARGACPTLPAPMATGDGLLARLNPVSGGVAPATLTAIAEAAGRFGNGLLEVTARGSLQIRGLTPTSAPQFAEAIDRLDIFVRSGVPVETGPLAGLDPQELADPTRLADSVRERIAKAGLQERLGPKVSVVVDGGGQVNLDAVLADVRLEAVRVDEKVLWRVAIGGTGETARPLGVVRIEAACEVVIGFLHAVAARGRNARARDLTACDLAAFEATRSFAPPFVLPCISPPREEIGRPRDFRQSAALRNAQGGRTVITLPLADGRVALGISLPFGQATTEQMAGFADAAAQHGVEEIRLALGRALLAICQTSTAADSLKSAAAALGFVTDPADPRLAVVACAGAPACASGHLPARALAAEMAADTVSILKGQVLHVSGCAKQCARPAHAAFTLIGTATGAELHFGDGREGAPVVRVANDDAAAAFRRAVKLYRKEKNARDKAATTR